MILDCENIDKTYESLEIILGLHRDMLCEILKDHTIIPNTVGQGKMQSELLFSQAFEQCINIKRKNFEPDSTVYFHMSRVFDSKDFKQGIMPLGLIISKLQKDLAEFVNNLNISMLPNKIVNRSSYNSVCHRLNATSLSGPYGILIKDMSACDENRHFLDVPETINDILSGYELKYQKNIIDEYRKATRPCIVKFQGEGIRGKSIKIALYYLYCKEHNIPLKAINDDGYDGFGKPVLKEHVLSIELI